MDTDSLPNETVTVSPLDRIVQGLTINGVPGEYLECRQPGLVAFVKNNRSMLPDIVSTILLTDADAVYSVNVPKTGSSKPFGRANLRQHYRESIVWLKWLMFEGDPGSSMENLAQMSGQRGVCGAVWGKNDIAFRCRTCEHDPTCAICVPCFQNGNHKNHDYSIIYTGGGCCDCGDETAWKREGFCSKHKGAEQIQPLPEEISNSVGPVLDALFSSWKDKLSVAEIVSGEDSSAKSAAEMRTVASELSYAVVETLLEFCKHSESLLSYVSKKVLSIDGLLTLLVRSERYLSIDVTKKLHELLLKLLGEPTFKYEFAKVFIDYYPVPLAEVLRVSSDAALKKYPLLSLFSVQIFTVPTLTPRLVKDWNLLGTLLDCLGEILLFCCDDDGELEFNKWVGVFDTVVRVMEDIKFVLSHSAVAEYVTQERTDIVQTWLQILSLVQGMNPQKRETGIHIEEENENAHLPFIMCNSIANIHLLLVKGAFTVTGIDEVNDESPFKSKGMDTDDGLSQRHAKVGRLSEESSACGATAPSSSSDSISQKFDGDLRVGILPSVCQFMFEALKAIDCWLAGCDIVAPGTITVSPTDFLATKKESLKSRRGKYTIISDSMSTDGSQNSSSDGTCPMDTGTGNIDYNKSTMETGNSGVISTLSLLSLSYWPHIDYDVSSQEVSVHMPLHGLLSLILKEAFRNCCVDYMATDKDGFGCLSSSSGYPEFFEKLLRGCHPFGFSSFLMEHPLQSRVFCAQVRAGMWRKNGDAATVCFEWYRSIRWSDHELELDLFLLQICAALAPPEFYVRRLLERFQLSDFLTLDPKRSSEYEPVLVQEFLTLIIQIVKERRFSGLTPSENLHRELVCKLATGDATHSQLVKSLPRDLSKLDQLQEVLDKVAQYSNPSGINQGKYALRLSYWKELDLYHPCWNPRDLQVAEERYSRFCGVSALSSQLPKWTNIYKPLIGIAKIATCETVLQITRAVLFYYVATDRSAESRAPDGVLITSLHLLSLGLDICSVEQRSSHTSSSIPLLDLACQELGFGVHHEESRGDSLLSLLVLLMRRNKRENVDNFTEAGNFNLSFLVKNLLGKFAELDSKCMTTLQQIAPEVVNYQADQTIKSNSASDTEKRKMKARERQAAILAKMKAEQSKFLATLKSASDTGSDDSCLEKGESASDVSQKSQETHICCLCHDPNSKIPVSFLILLQKSRLVFFVDHGSPSWDQDLRYDGSESSFEEVRRINTSRNGKAVASGVISYSHLAQLIQGSVDEFASEAHPAELSAFGENLKIQFPELRSINIPGKSCDKRDDIVYFPESFELSVSSSIQKEMVVNINNATSSKRDDGKGVLVKGDASESYHPDCLLLGKYIASLTKDNKDSSQNSTLWKVESSGQVPSYDGFGPSDCDGIHVSSCGHAVHQGCLDRYLTSLKERNTRRMIFEGGHILDPDQGEFLCPVCRRLANSTLPSAPSDSHTLWEPIQFPVSSPHSLEALAESHDECTFQLQYALSLLQTASCVVSRGETLKSLSVQHNRRIRPNLEPLFEMLSEMYFPGKRDIFSRYGRISPSPIMWDTLKYSLVSMEIASRCGKTCLTARKGLHSLFSEYKASGEFVLPLLLRIIQSSRSNNVVDVLLRLRGIQLFAASINSGVNYDKCHKAASGKEGSISRILKQTNPEMVFPDTLFWDQASDPVLTRDPFSTLMWILFCLPYPFLSSTESFFSLVHLCYAVVIAQAVITYCARAECDMNELGFHDCMVTDIAKVTGNSVVAKQFFRSNYVGPSCHIKDVVHNLSLPYLRRCALLGKLLKSCSVFTSPSSTDDNDGLSDIMGCPDTSDTQGVIDEVNELRNMFGIPSLDAILKDELLRLTVLKWFHHFSEEFENRNVHRALYLTPSVPFKLMHLPFVYQDLLQRYIKPRCLNCKDVQDDPALCLLCGRLCSPAWKPCCRESGCQTHAMTCGAGTGIFLLIRKTTIMLQRNARQAPWPSPYLDTFGEEDIDMNRGKPLFLNEERYAALTYMVASHGLDRSSKVLRQATNRAFFLA